MIIQTMFSKGGPILKPNGTWVENYQRYWTHYNANGFILLHLHGDSNGTAAKKTFLRLHQLTILHNDPAVMTFLRDLDF